MIKGFLSRKQPAFTLMEMTVAITIFTIFMGLATGSYLFFHRAQQEAILTRTLLLEMEAVMQVLTDAIHDHLVDYDSYETIEAQDSLFGTDDRFRFLQDSDPIQTSRLQLIDPNDSERIVFEWNQVQQSLTEQRFDSNGEPLPGFLEPLPLHSSSTDVTHMSFSIFPAKNPFELESIPFDELQYQPIVQMVMHFTGEGRVSDTVTLDLQTSVTSRFYSN